MFLNEVVGVPLDIVRGYYAYKRQYATHHVLWLFWQQGRSACASSLLDLRFKQAHRDGRTFLGIFELLLTREKVLK